MDALRAKLQTLGIDTSFLTAIDDDYTEAEKELFDRWAERVDSSIASTRQVKTRLQGWYYGSQDSRFRTFLVGLEELYVLSGLRDPSVCGKLPIDRAAHFVALKTRARGHFIGSGCVLHVPKAELLMMTGFEGNILELAAQIEVLGKRIPRWGVSWRRRRGPRSPRTCYLVGPLCRPAPHRTG